MTGLFAVSVRNLLRDALAAPVAKSEQVGFEAEHVRDGRPWHPFRFAAVGDDYIDFAMRSYYEGFEAAFVGGLPAATGAVWSKAGGTTLTRNTSTPDTGAACLQVDGGAAASGMADIVLPAGHWWNVSFKARAGTSGSWRVRLQDLMTRRWFHRNSGQWTTDPASYLGVGNNTGGYATVDTHFLLEPSDVVGAPWTKVRIEFSGNATTPAPLFDEIEMWPSINIMAIVGHNVPPSGVTFDLRGDDTSPATTLRLQSDVARPTAFGVLLDGSGYPTPFHYRHYRLWLPNPPLQDPTAIGLVWLGQVTFLLSDHPEYPLSVEATLPQARSGVFGGESQAALRADLRVRTLDLAVTSGSMTAAVLVEQALSDTRYGADRALLIAPYRNANTAFYGRFDPQLTEQQLGLNSVSMRLRFEEQPFFRLMP